MLLPVSESNGIFVRHKMAVDLFDKDRSNLNHTRLKNGFLVAIAYHPEDATSEDRKEKIVEALEGDNGRQEQVRRAFLLWPELEDEIKSFIHEIPARYGFVVSDAFTSERNSVDNALTQVSGFVARFLEGQTNKKELDDFWSAMDIVTGFLSRLGSERKRYILDFDPNLKKGI